MQGRGARCGRAIAAIALVATLAACSGGGDKEATGATVPASLATTTTTDPYAVPQVIDTAYVNRVLAAMDAGIGEVVRIIYRTREMRAEVYDRLRAFYAEGNTLKLATESLQDDLLDDFEGYKPNPGDTHTAVETLITVRSDCIFLEAARDFSEIGTNPNPANSQLWLGLKPLDQKRDIGEYNATGWMIVYEGYAPGRRQPTDPCVTS